MLPRLAPCHTNYRSLYFSVNGSTKKFAEEIAEATQGDLFEIVPVQEYAEEDLRLSGAESRSLLEAHDKAARPEISSKVTLMPQYDVVFVGFPIWWRIEPRIIDTFLESYNFAGKTIVPFVTSDGPVLKAGQKEVVETFGHLLAGIEREYGLGEIDEGLHALLGPDVNWKPGKAMPTDHTAEDVRAWIEMLGL